MIPDKAVWEEHKNEYLVKQIRVSVVNCIMLYKKDDNLKSAVIGLNVVHKFSVNNETTIEQLV